MLLCNPKQQNYVILKKRMRTIFITALANSIYVLHAIIFLVLVFGWLSTKIYVWYIALIALTLLFWFTIGYCPLTKLEFYLRKKLNPQLEYDFTFLGYYGHTFLQRQISHRFVKYSGRVFLLLSLLVNVVLPLTLR